MHEENSERSDGTITRRGFLGATLASVAAASLFFQNVHETFATPFVDFRNDHALRLNMNENPFGPSPRALLAAMKKLPSSNFYLNPTIEKLYRALMKHEGIEKDMLILGAGSWEILRTAPLSHYESGGNIVSTRQTFPYPLDYAEHLGFMIKKVDHIIDHQGRWEYDVEGLLEAVDSGTRLLYLVNPNNPTGAWLDYEQLKYMADSLPPSVLFLVDEAYVQFLGDVQRNGIDLVKEGYENVLVTRTFSKVYGLAGLRVGYGVSHPDVIRHLRGFTKDFLSINTAGSYGAIAALEDGAFVSKCIVQAMKTLSFYEREFSSFELPYVIEKGPFVMADVSMDADVVVEKMARQRVLVAPGKAWDMPTYIRISYGTDMDNRRAIRALRNALK